MEFSLILLEKLISMMLMALVGYILVKTGALRQEDSKVISVLLAFVLQPCLILHSLQIELTPERLRGFVFGAVLAASAMVLSILFSVLVKRPLHLDGVDCASLVYANVGNLLMPLVSMSLGTEMVFYCSVFQIPFHLLFWTHGVTTIREDKELNIRKILLNPSIIALTVSIIFLFARITFPSVIGSAVKGFQDMIAASSMLLVGMVMAGCDLKSVFTSRRSYLISFLRLILLPVLCMFLLYLTGLIRRYPELRAVSMIIILGVAAPTASMIVQIAVVYDKNAAKAGFHNVMSTILCVLTMPLIIFLFQILFPA